MRGFLPYNFVKPFFFISGCFAVSYWYCSMVAITVMIATCMQIHSRPGLTHGSLANLYFAHCELCSLQIEQTIHGSLCKVQIHALRRAIYGLCKIMLYAQHMHCTCTCTCTCMRHGFTLCLGRSTVLLKSMICAQHVHVHLVWRKVVYMYVHVIIMRVCVC